MPPFLPDAPSFWPVGGDVLAGGRPLSRDEANALVHLYACAHGEAVAARDRVAAAYISGQRRALAAALQSAAQWRRAGSRIA